MRNTTKKENEQAKTKKTRQETEIAQPFSPHLNQVPATSSFGKNLQRCGIDTAILETNVDQMECVRYAQDKQRYILTRGDVFNKLYKYVPQEHCLKILSDNVDKPFKEFIDYYKVIVSQSCNGKSFVKVSRLAMLALKNLPDYPRFCPLDDNDSRCFATNKTKMGSSF